MLLFTSATVLVWCRIDRFWAIRSSSVDDAVSAPGSISEQAAALLLIISRLTSLVFPLRLGWRDLQEDVLSVARTILIRRWPAKDLFRSGKMRDLVTEYVALLQQHDQTGRNVAQVENQTWEYFSTIPAGSWSPFPPCR